MNAQTQNNALQGIVLIQGEQTIEGQIKARQNALKSCVQGRESLSEGISAGMFTGWINGHKKALRELYFRRAVLTAQ